MNSRLVLNLFVVCLNLIPSESDVTSDGYSSICSHYRKVFDSVQVLSVFSLDRYVMIQLRSPNQDSTQMWQITDTEPLDSNHPDQIDVSMQNNHKFLPKFFDWLKLSQKNFSDTMRISGHVMIQEEAYIDICPQFANKDYTFTTDINNPCYEVQEVVQSGQLYICLYGHQLDYNVGSSRWKITTSGAFIFDPSFGTFLTISYSDNYSKLDPRCRSAHPDLPKGQSSLLIDYRYDNITNVTGETIFITLKGIDETVGHLNATAKHPKDEKVNYNQIHSIFSFNSFYQLYACPLDCTFKSNITKMKILNEWSMILIKQINFTLAQLIGCPLQYNIFDPLDYCTHARKEEFQSIFSLGNDIYYQRRGMIYRYRREGFITDQTSRGPNDTFKICPLRYDSDTTVTLEREGFDSGYKIIGFSFKRNRNTLKMDLECDENVEPTCRYDMACLKGAHQNYKVHTRAFKLYPSGLVRFGNRSDLFPNASGHQPDIYRTYANLVCHTLFSKLYEDYKDGDVVGVASVESATTYMLYAYIYDWDGYFIKKVQWKKYYAHNWLERLESQKAEITDFEHKIVGMFTMGRDVFLQVKYKGHIYRGEPFKSSLHWVFVENRIIVDCPCNQSRSLVTIRRPLPLCQKIQFETHSESVFNIGPKEVHQSGQHFYVYNDDFGDYFYNKYLTQLFYDYFDTRYRVTGYSTNLNHIIKENEYQVLIHGKSSYAYRGLGEYIYALFYFKNSSSLPMKLIPMISSELKTFLAREPESDAQALLGVLCPSIKGNFLDAWGYHQILLNNRSNQVFTSIVMDIDEKSGLVHETENYFAKDFVFPLRRDCKFNVSGNGSPQQSGWIFKTSRRIDRLVGLMVDYMAGEFGSMYLVMRNMSDPYRRLMKILYAYPDTNKQASNQAEFNESEIIDYWQWYCNTPGEIDGGRHSSRESNRNVSIILGAFVLILLIIAILVAMLTSYFKGQSAVKSRTTK